MSMVFQPTTPGSSNNPRAITITSNPSTPTSQILQASVQTPSPGLWQHPKFDEITRRQREGQFNDSNLRKIGWNGAALAALLYGSFHPPISDLLTQSPFSGITPALFISISLVFIYNITIALLPLTRAKDDLTNIDLTPTQRALLGLDPNATPPPTPGTQYITPPRYPPSPKPRNFSPTGSPYGTPTSRKASPRNDTPSSTPLWGKGRGGGRDTMRRYSSGTPSPLGPGLGANDRSVLGAAPSTPSPTMAGKGASVGLNSKWLYERGRSSSASGRSLYS